MTDKILLVEDEEEIRGTIAAELHDAGYQVIQAANGREGLTVIRREKPDLVLSDIAMPILDGIGMLEAMRKELPDQIGTPFIFLTAYNDRERQIAARRHGADEFLNKPVDFEVLLAIVENQLRKRRASKEHHDDDLVKLFKKLHLGTGRPSFAHGRRSDDPVWESVPSPQHEPSGGHSVGGWIRLIGLDDVKEKLGPRWSKVATTVMHLAENRIAQNLSEQDTYRAFSDDTFEICIHSKSEAETSATVRRIKQQILDSLGAIEQNDNTLPGVDQGDLVALRQVQAEFYPLPAAAEAEEAHDDLMDVVSAKINRAAKAFIQNAGEMLAQIVQDGEIRSVPILDRALASTHMAQCVLDPAATSTELRMRSAFAHDPQKMLELDMTKFGLAIQHVISGQSREIRSFVVSVDVNSIRMPKSRQRYLSLLTNVPHATRSKFIFLIENGLGQVHASLLTDIVRSLKPFSITCWMRATTAEPLDKSLNEAVAPVVAMSYLDLEDTIRTNSEKLRMFRKNIASSKILFLIDGLVDNNQHEKIKKLTPNYYCFDGFSHSIDSNT